VCAVPNMAVSCSSFISCIIIIIIFFIYVFLGSKLCPSLIDKISHTVPPSNITNFTLFCSRQKSSFGQTCNSWKFGMQWHRHI
jgi:hypothetical protein